LLQLWFWALLVSLCFAVALIPVTHPVLADTTASIAFWAVLMGAWYMFGGFFLGWTVVAFGCALIAVGVLVHAWGLPLTVQNAWAGVSGGMAFLATGTILRRGRPSRD
jgi:hypothetical protein